MSNSRAGFWEIKKKKLIKKFPLITNNDLNYKEGKEKKWWKFLDLNRKNQIRNC